MPASLHTLASWLIFAAVAMLAFWCVLEMVAPAPSESSDEDWQL